MCARRRTSKRPLLGKAVKAYSVFAPAKMPVLEIEDVNTMWFVRPRGRRDTERESQSLSTQGSNIEDDDEERRVLPAGCPICDVSCDAGR